MRNNSQEANVYVTSEQFKAILEQHIKEIKQLTASFCFNHDDIEESYHTVTLEDIESGRIKIDKAEEILALARDLNVTEAYMDTLF